MSPSTQNLCIERPVDGVFDINGSSLPDNTNDQGLGGYAFIGPTYVEYDWQLLMMYAEQRFIDNPLVTYVMTNSDGSIFGSGSFYVTEDNNTTFTMETLLRTCLNELNNRYDEICNIPPSHQEAIAWEISYDEEYTIPWYANDYAHDLELSITSNNTSELVSLNVDKRGGWIGPWYAKDSVSYFGAY